MDEFITKVETTIIKSVSTCVDSEQIGTVGATVKEAVVVSITDTSLCFGRGVLLCKLCNARSLCNKLFSYHLTFSSSLNHD